MQNAEVKVKGSDAKVLNFCANNYLGLSSHPQVVSKKVLGS
jgi:glycine C-acetyltransferase